jgi:hypothetical protein
MCKAMTEIKKVRSVRFNDEALETIYPIACLDEYGDRPSFGLFATEDESDTHHDVFENLNNDNEIQLVRCGSHESLYKLASFEPTGNLIRKKRDNDLDDSNHQRNHNNYQTTSSAPTMMKRKSRQRGCHEDLDISHHERRHERRVMCF